METSKKYAFKGADTNGLMIDKEWCIDIMLGYLETRGCLVVCRDELMFVLDKDENHIITLEWHNCGFNLEEDFTAMDAYQLEIVLIGINIVSRSILENYTFTKIDRTERIKKLQADNADRMATLDDDESDSEDYWI